MSEVAIKVENLSKMYKLYDRPMDRLKESLGLTKKKKYKEYYALNNINMEIKRGETVGIIGTNGAGKSTILKIITGVLNQTNGDVTINGRISALLELGAGFNPEYTGIENVYLNGTMIGFTREEIDEKLQDIIDFADIGDFINQPVKTYSSGMFVRLAFAVAINIDPEILIVDEALSVGDVFFQSKCYRKFEEFKELGKTILFVSHDLGSIIKYCDRVVLLNKGNKVGEGEPGEMVDTYKMILANQYVEEDNNDEDKEDNEQVEEAEPSFDGFWKERLGLNSSFQDYGDGRITIIDFGIFDRNGNITNVIEKNEKFSIKVKLHVNQKMESPIIAYTIKDKKGTELTGTNTLIESIDTTYFEADHEYVISFEQVASLQGGEYLLSLGCTQFEGDSLSIMHRLYDITYLTILSEKNTIGYYDMYSDVTVEEI